MKNRIELIRQHEGMSYSEFAEAIGVGRATITHILQGRNNPSLDVTRSIHKRFPKVSLVWLLDGEGDMFISETKVTHVTEAKNYQADLFSGLENRINAPVDTDENKYAKEIAPKTPYIVPEPTVKEVIKYVEKEPSKITEIRIFFDDGRYEIFKPENKE